MEALLPAVAREPAASPSRSHHLRRALRLEYFTVGWNLLEGAVSVAAAAAAGSIVLLGFGVDSFVESASGLILVWRLRAEVRMREAASGERIERIERQARRGVALSLFALAAYVALESLTALVARERPEPSLIGIAITIASLAAMAWLARRKRALAARLGSGALRADSVQTMACWWLSWITLTGVALNAAFGWWWADPVAALAMTVFLVREGREAWRGEER